MGKEVKGSANSKRKKNTTEEPPRRVSSYSNENSPSELALDVTELSLLLLFCL